MITPIGLKLIKSFVAAPFNSTTVEFIVPEADTIELFLNDPVKTINETDETGIDFCQKANPGDFLRGYIVGIVAEHDKENDIYRKTATRRRVRVCQDPFLLARAVVDAAVTTTDIGKYIDMDSGGGNTITGISEVSLDYTTISDTTGQFKILQIEEVDTDDDQSIVLCSIAKHELLKGTAGTEDFWDRSGAALFPHYAGDSINGGSLTTQTLPLRNNIIDDLGFDINADGSLTVNAPAYEALVTDDDDIPNRKFVIDAILELSHTQYEFFTATAGQTTFTILGPTPINPTAAQIAVQGVVFKYGADPASDFIISGNTITWYNNNYTMQNGDVPQIWYDGPGSAAPEWSSYSGTLPVAGAILVVTAAQLGLSDARQIVEGTLWGRGTDQNWYFAGNTWGGATHDFNFTIPTLADPNLGDLVIQVAGTASTVAGQPFKLSFWHQNTNFLT